MRDVKRHRTDREIAPLTVWVQVRAKGSSLSTSSSSANAPPAPCLRLTWCIRSLCRSFGRSIGSFGRPFHHPFIRSAGRSLVWVSIRSFFHSFGCSIDHAFDRPLIHLFVRYSDLRSTTHLLIRDSVDRPLVDSAVLYLIVRSTTHSFCSSILR